jgi:hypothetical protein
VTRWTPSAVTANTSSCRKTKSTLPCATSKARCSRSASSKTWPQARHRKKTGVERRTPSDEERRLIKQVEEAKRQGGYTVTDPATQLRSALQAVKTRLANQIKDLEHQIATRQKIVKTRSKLPYDAEANLLQTRRNELRDQFYEIFGKPGLTDAQRSSGWKTSTASRIKELEGRLKTKNFAPRPKRAPIQLDAEGLKLQADNERLKTQYQTEVDKGPAGSPQHRRKGCRRSC